MEFFLVVDHKPRKRMPKKLMDAYLRNRDRHHKCAFCPTIIIVGSVCNFCDRSNPVAF